MIKDPLDLVADYKKIDMFNSSAVNSLRTLTFIRNNFYTNYKYSANNFEKIKVEHSEYIEMLSQAALACGGGHNLDVVLCLLTNAHTTYNKFATKQQLEGFIKDELLMLQTLFKQIKGNNPQKNSNKIIAVKKAKIYLNDCLNELTTQSHIKA